jgi:YD repeat-containing protein
MKSRTTPLLFLIAALLGLSVPPSRGQNVGTGLPPFAQIDSSGFDNINLRNLNVNIPITLFARTDRGQGFFDRLIYDSPVWSISYLCPTYGETCWVMTGGQWTRKSSEFSGYLIPSLWSHGTVGQSPQTLISGSWATQSYGVPCPEVSDDSGGAWDPGGYYEVFYEIDFEDNDRTVHSFPIYEDTETYSCGGAGEFTSSTNQLVAADMSGWRLSYVYDNAYGVTQLAATDPRGTVYPNMENTRDRNGNVVVSPLIETMPTSGEEDITYPTSSDAGVAQYRILLSAHQYQGPCNDGVTKSGNLIDSIILADGTSYSFTYDQYYRLTGVTLPTGGTYSYTYQVAGDTSNGFSCPTGPATGDQFVNSTLTRTIDGVSTWQYQALSEYQTVAVDPSGSSVAHQFCYFGECLQSGNGTTTTTSYTLPPQVTCMYSTPARVTVVQTTNLEDNSSSNVISCLNQFGQTYDTKFYDYGTSLSAVPDREDASIIDTSDLPTLVTRRQLFDKGTLLHDTLLFYDENSLAPSGSTGLAAPYTSRRGNNTSTYGWQGGDTWVQSENTYYDNGLMHTQQDPNGNITTYIYDACNHSFPTEVDLPLGLVRHMQWECNSEQVTSSTDENGNSTVYTYGDSYFSRLTRVDRPDGGATVVTYDDSARTVETQVRKDPTSGTTPDNGWTSSIVVNDDLGRRSRTMQYTGGGQWETLDTSYDTMGNIGFVTVPYFSSGPTSAKVTSGDGTSYSFDAFDRPSGTSYISGSTTDSSHIAYYGRDSEVTDESGVSKLYRKDAFGGIIDVCEITGAVSDPSCGLGLSGNGYTTSYKYSGAGDLLSVNQHGQGRTFSYDGLSRLVTAQNPESGIVCYGVWSGGNCVNGYDPNGNLQFKTDARGITTSFGYDSLNRLLSKSYVNDVSGSPSSCYQYDSTSTVNGIGRLAAQWTQRGACSSTPGAGVPTKTVFAAYDPMGRVTSKQQCVFGSCSQDSVGQATYGYDLAGHLTSFGDGLGLTQFTNQFDSVGRLQTLSSSWIDLLHPPTLFSAQSYSAAGGLTNALYGVFGQNGGTALTQTRTYDNRLRATSETDVGNIVQAPAVPGTATVTITGSELSK